MSKYKLKKMVEDLNLEILAGEKGLDAYIEDENVTRPSMEFAGFFDFYESKRVLLIGSKESTFLSHLQPEIAKARVKYLFQKQPPCIIISKNVMLPEYFKDFSNEFNICLLKSELRTTPLNSKVYSYLQSRLAPRQTVHGVLMDINGMGTLIIGKSGIGKSETALELIKRGHQLISDDRVDIYEREQGYIIGNAPEVLERYLEIRGIGIVDVVKMFGAGAFRKSKRVQLVVELEKWEADKYYDRLGLSNDTVRYFNSDIVHVVIPVLPGRNVSLLVESAAMNEKLKIFGYNSALEFTQSINNLAKRGEVDED